MTHSQEVDQQITIDLGLEAQARADLDNSITESNANTVALRRKTQDRILAKELGITVEELTG